MELLIGAGLSLIVGLFATVSGLDRGRSFYPTVLIVIASYYDLFAIMGEGGEALGAETCAFAVFVLFSVVGLRTSMWIVVAALAGHGLFDVVHGRLIDNPGVPAWWPMFCLSYDAAAAAYLAWRIVRRKMEATETTRFGARIRPQVEAELLAARQSDSRGDALSSFHHLERAHVLGQASTREHVRVHLSMLGWAVRHRRHREMLGQVQRIIGAGVATPLGLIPYGNTGGSNVHPFRSMPIAPDLAAIIAAARVSVGSAVSLIVALTAFLGTGACSALADTTLVPPVAADLSLPADARVQESAFRVLGAGEPIIVLISGLGDGMATFGAIAGDLAQFATVIAYDRSGYGASEVAAGPKDALAAEAELTGVLRRSGVAGPYVLVGHSLGGLFAEFYAARHPDMIAGLVLEESRPASFARACETAGLAACTPTQAMVQTAPAGALAEIAGLAQTQAQVEAAGVVSGRPVLILSRPIAADASPWDLIWAGSQRDLARRYPGSRHLVAPSGGHNLHLTQRAWFVATLKAFAGRIGPE